MRNLAVKNTTTCKHDRPNLRAINTHLDVNGLAKNLGQSVCEALYGPNGLFAPDAIAALSALAGYCARWQTHLAIAEDKTIDDFQIPHGCNMPFVETSKQVEAKICSLTGRSFASTLISAMMIGDAQWLPHINKNLDHNFTALNQPAFPDYTVGKNVRPSIPPQALLLMLWDSQIQNLIANPQACNAAVVAYSLASAELIIAHSESFTPSQTAQMALETAIAMSRLSYGF